MIKTVLVRGIAIPLCNVGIAICGGVARLAENTASVCDKAADAVLDYRREHPRKERGQEE